MSEITTNTPQVFRIKKTRPGTVIFALTPVSNPNLTRVVSLTEHSPSVNLPIDWALGVFTDEALYGMYKQGYFSFDKNKELVKEAQRQGVFFDEVLDFVPAEDHSAEILTILKKGMRSELEAAEKKFGKELVKDVAIDKLSELPVGIVNLLEQRYNIQLTID